MSMLLRHPEPGTVKDSVNNSKGCGDVMRVAPYGLVYPMNAAVRFAIDDAASIHGHELGWLPVPEARAVPKDGSGFRSDPIRKDVC